MGNAGGAARGALHVLEFRLSPIQADPPRGRNGLYCSILARVSALGDEEIAKEVAWDEPAVLRLEGEASVVSVTIYARENGMPDAEEKFLTQVCLPYAGAGCLGELGLQPGGAPVPLKLALSTGRTFSGRETEEELAGSFQDARRNVRPDRPCLLLSVRELAPELPSAGLDDTSWNMPPARRQLVALELQNAALQRQRGDLEDSPLCCAQQLQMVLEENEQIRLETARVRQKRERAKAVLSSPSSLTPSQHALDWRRTLEVMRSELAHCGEQQEKIRQNYEERVAGLEAQLQRAWRASSQEISADPQTKAQLDIMEQELVTYDERIQFARRRREGLSRQLAENRKRQEAGCTLPSSSACANPEVLDLRQRSQCNAEELERLRQKLHLEQQNSSERSKDLRRSVEQLYDDLDELRRVRKDECVRAESEIREIKIERDLLRDRLDDAVSELQNLRSQSEVLKSMREEASEGPAALLSRLREENAERALELQRLKSMEEERQAQISALEQSQEVLVQQISQKAQPQVDTSEEYLQVLQAREQELAVILRRLDNACQAHEDEIDRLRSGQKASQREAELLGRKLEELQAGSRGASSASTSG